jgi:hypothetical protein
VLTHHFVAGVSIAGSTFDFFGGLYLAYDLLGGQRGPLRTLTRALTYSLLTGVGFAAVLGWRFAIPAGTAVGFTVAVELARASRGEPNRGLAWDSLFSLIRAIGYGIGLYPTFGWRFAALFAVLITLGQIVAYSMGTSPHLTTNPPAGCGSPPSNCWPPSIELWAVQWQPSSAAWSRIARSITWLLPSSSE